MDLDAPIPTGGTPTGTTIAALARRLDRPIVLVGMMGVGKSSLGRKLASALGVPFIDADDSIELAAQMTIAEIFATHGEPYFRDGERRVIARLLRGGDEQNVSVIATGGGAFCNPATRALILEQALAVWIDADLDTLVERTARKGNRPLLHGGDPRAILGRLRDERAADYAQCPIHVMSDNTPQSRTLGRVLGAIALWLDGKGGNGNGNSRAAAV